MQKGSAMSSFAMPLMPYFESGLKLLHATGQLQAHVLSGVMRYQIETLAFLKHRCEQGVKLVDNFVGSGEFNDIFDIFSNFMQNTTSDYGRQDRRDLLQALPPSRQNTRAGKPIGRIVAPLADDTGESHMRRSSDPILYGCTRGRLNITGFAGNGREKCHAT
jgi:hypothetical protein